jgi:hypothetical protein
MRIKILFDDEVVHESEVKNAEISQSRDVIALYSRTLSEEHGKPMITEMVPSVVERICIDCEMIEKPNTNFFLMSCDSVPRKTSNVRMSCPECKKDIKVRV